MTQILPKLWPVDQSTTHTSGDPNHCFTNYCPKKMTNHSTKSPNIIKFYPKNLYRLTQIINMLFINLSRTFQQLQNVSTHPNTPQFVSRTPYPTTCLFASKISHKIDKYSINIYKKWLTKKAS